VSKHTESTLSWRQIVGFRGAFRVELGLLECVRESLSRLQAGKPEPGGCREEEQKVLRGIRGLIFGQTIFWEERA